MAQTLRIDLDRLRALSPEIAQIAEAAQRELTALETALAREGRCWGDDEPGRMFGESYEPALEDGLTAFRAVIEKLGRAGIGVGETADRFEQQDHEGGRSVQDAPRWITSAPIPDPHATAAAPDSPLPYTGATPSYPHLAPVMPAGIQPVPAAAAPPDSPVAPSDYGRPTSAAADTAAGAPVGAGRPHDNIPTGTSAGTPQAATPKPAGRTDPAVVSRGSTSPAPNTAGGAPGTPWSRPAGSSAAVAPAAPGRRDAAAAPRGQVFAPGGGAPPPPPPASQPHGRRAGTSRQDGKPDRKKPDPVTTRRIDPVSTDPAAVETARLLARRHRLRLTGFETSGISAHTMDQIAAAFDHVLGRYPFLPVGGVEIGELRRPAISKVHWTRPPDTPPVARIGLRGGSFADPASIAEEVLAAARSARIAPAAGERPVYATIVGALGRVMADTAGAPARRLAQQSLITEYHRVSGPWTPDDTLTSVVRGYRQWRAQLSGACFRRGRLHPRAALVDAFTEVELLGEQACGPAKALHRLMVEKARGRSGP